MPLKERVGRGTGIAYEGQGSIDAIKDRPVLAGSRHIFPSRAHHQGPEALYGRQQVAGLSLIFRLPVTDVIEEGVKSGVVEIAAFFEDFVDFDGGIGNEDTGRNCPIPINIKIPAAVGAASSKAAFHQDAVIPEIGQEDLALADDIPIIHFNLGNDFFDHFSRTLGSVGLPLRTNPMI